MCQPSDGKEVKKKEKSDSGYSRDIQGIELFYLC